MRPPWAAMLRSATVVALALLVARVADDPRLLVPLAVGGLYASANDTTRHPAGRVLHALSCPRSPVRPA